MLRADRSFATARSRGQQRCPSSPSCSSTTSPSSCPRPGPSTAFPSSTASRAAAVHSSLPHWLPPLLKSQPQPLPGSHKHPPTEVPGKLGLSQKPHDHHLWAATPLSVVLAPLGSAPTLLLPLRAPLPLSSPQPQKAHPHGVSPVLLSSLPPPSSHRRRIRRYRPWPSTDSMEQEACLLWAPGDLASVEQRAWSEEVVKATWPPGLVTV